MLAIKTGWQHQFVDTNQVRLHCVTQGEGELVILLHGFLEFWYSWRRQIPALARHFKVVVPDLRGYNDSEKPSNGYDLDTLSRDIQGLIKGLGYSQAHVVGHDWGGAIAWRLAQRCPQLLSRLVVLNAPHPHGFGQDLFGNLDQIRWSSHLLALQIPGLPDWLIQTNLRDLVTHLFQNQAIRKGAFTTQDTELYQAALRKPGSIAAAMNYYRQFVSGQFWGRSWGRLTKPITAPTLVLWSEENTRLNQNTVDGIENFVSAPFQLKRVPQCGHWIQQEVPQTVNRELLNFLCIE
ncbi:MAG: alpha/beta hydrolase [Leptolyngbyaceae cyanobacterium MO_188.B28]|nr:alpha/beta hydrolase [Leptolyngbyaceae cyanobacterium MO_188.B28]